MFLDTKSCCEYYTSWFRRLANKNWLITTLFASKHLWTAPLLVLTKVDATSRLIGDKWMGISENDVCNAMKDYGGILRGCFAYLLRQNSRERLPAIAERPPAPLIFCISDHLLFDRSVPLNIAVDGSGK